MAIQGTFIIYNLDKKYLHKINAYMKMAVNSLNSIKNDRKADTYAEFMQGYNLNDKSMNKRIYQKYKTLPYIDLKPLSLAECNIFLSKEFRSLKEQKIIDNSPLYVASFDIFNGHIKPSKEFIFNLINSITKTCKCTILLDIEDNKKISADRFLSYDGTLQIGEKQIASSLLSQINLLKYYVV